MLVDIAFLTLLLCCFLVVLACRHCVALLDFVGIALIHVDKLLFLDSLFVL
jgi:hypothetical protein